MFKVKRLHVAILFFALALVVILVNYENHGSSNKDLSYAFEKDTVVIKIKNATIYAKVAATPEKRETGLMNTTSLGINEGMLFIFESEGYHSFWMKDTLIPLEVMFIDSNFIVTEITKMDPCQPGYFNCKIYSPKSKIKYALEVNQNFSSKFNISTGDIVNIEKE
ncbi:MAG: DUF192 domain-containing protein [Candidatus Micrarchaeota archaeon]|nr:DUF192 domain-containing protein [Candidatus Micrarchaeota archaeon]